MKLDDIKKLQQKKYRDEFGYFLLEGEHLALELEKALDTNILLRGSEIYVSETYAHWQSALKIHVVSERQMAHIAATKTPQGIVAVVPILAATQLTTAPLLASVSSPSTQRAIYLHEIQDPGNLGTILRTLAWFGNFRCLLSANSVDPFNDKVVRASMGAIFHVPIEIDVPLQSLSERFAKIACLDMQGQSIQSQSFNRYDCYIFGNEARGVPRGQLLALNADAFTIPGGATIESLNLAAAVNICVYELQRISVE